jgi:hypothetical protein
VADLAAALAQLLAQLAGLGEQEGRAGILHRVFGDVDRVREAGEDDHLP